MFLCPVLPPATKTDLGTNAKHLKQDDLKVTWGNKHWANSCCGWPHARVLGTWLFVLSPCNQQVIFCGTICLISLGFHFPIVNGFVHFYESNGIPRSAHEMHDCPLIETSMGHVKGIWKHELSPFPLNPRFSWVPRGSWGLTGHREPCGCSYQFCLLRDFASSITAIPS